MDSSSNNVYSAFNDNKLLAQGSLTEVITKVKNKVGKSADSSILIFSDATGKIMDFNFEGSMKDVLKRIDVFVSDQVAPNITGPGRPKLGVVSREISLLPRHWEWLANQPQGASATLRKLVEEAKKTASEGNLAKQAQERVYKFMSVLAGDFAGYEEALRALYKKDKAKLLQHIAAWPKDVQKHILHLSKELFS